LQPITSSECKEIGAKYYGLVATFQNSCPSGYELRCEEQDEEDAEPYFVYYYSDDFIGLTCADLED